MSFGDYELDDLACPACGHEPTHSRRCGECDDGYNDEYDDDPINFTPGESLIRCVECHGTGIERWCPQCGADYWVAKAAKIRPISMAVDMAVPVAWDTETGEPTEFVITFEIGQIVECSYIDPPVPEGERYEPGAEVNIMDGNEILATFAVTETDDTNVKGRIVRVGNGVEDEDDDISGRDDYWAAVTQRYQVIEDNSDDPVC